MCASRPSGCKCRRISSLAWGRRLVVGGVDGGGGVGSGSGGGSGVVVVVVVVMVVVVLVVVWWGVFGVGAWVGAGE